jgi:hypothetical protein
MGLISAAQPSVSIHIQACIGRWLQNMILGQEPPEEWMLDDRRTRVPFDLDQGNAFYLSL